jgi:hypothetical protein
LLKRCRAGAERASELLDLALQFLDAHVPRGDHRDMQPMHVHLPQPFLPHDRCLGGGVGPDEGGPRGPTSSGRHGTPHTSVVTAKA